MASRKANALILLFCASALLTAARTHAQGIQGLPPAEVLSLPPLNSGTGSESQAFAINNAGEVAGESTVNLSGGGTAVHAFLWTITTNNCIANPETCHVTASGTDLGTLIGSGDSAAYGIDSNGDIVGYSDAADGSVQGFLWQPSTLNGPASNSGMVALSPLGGSNSVAYAVDNKAGENGEIVGASDDKDGNTHACEWDLQSLDANDLDFLSSPATATSPGGTGDYSAAYGINDLGHIVGEVETVSGDTHAALFQVSPLDLGVMSGGTQYQGTYSSARAINNSDAITGEGDFVSTGGSEQDEYPGFYMLWSFPVRTHGLMYPIIGGIVNTYNVDQTTSLDAINNLDQMVGQTANANSGAAPGAGIVWASYFDSPPSESEIGNILAAAYTIDQGPPVDGAPPQWVTHDPAWNLEDATGINDSSQVVGYGLYNGASTAFLVQLPKRDGANPHAPLLRDSSGNLYGTTSDGGANGAGTVFEVNANSDPNAPATVLHNFNIVDGYPEGGLVAEGNGNFYGITTGGVVYEITPSAQSPSQMYTVLNDGFAGVDELVYDGSEYLYGAGTTINPTYASMQLYNVAFQMSLDGDVSSPWPVAVPGQPNGLTMGSDGLLYGTTQNGGDSGDGTVYKLWPATGSSLTLYSFGVGVGDPLSPLLYGGGQLYGSTSQQGLFGIGYGGAGFSDMVSVGPIVAGPLCLGPYDGQTNAALYFTTHNPDSTSDYVVQAVNCNGGGFTCVKDMYAFLTGTSGDGTAPESGLIVSGNPSDAVLYGTTFEGGKGINESVSTAPGYGTVYSISVNPSINSSGQPYYLDQILHFFGG